ncbi:hypothetical protein Bca4012_050747 [Brassica carinata]
MLFLTFCILKQQQSCSYYAGDDLFITLLLLPNYSKKAKDEKLSSFLSFSRRRVEVKDKTRPTSAFSVLKSCDCLPIFFNSGDCFYLLLKGIALLFLECVIWLW